MKKHQGTVLAFVLIVFVGTVGFNVTAPRRHNPVFTRSQKSSPAPRTAAQYSAFFHLVVELRTQADELENAGRNGASVRGYVQDHTKLSDVEARKLEEIAAECVEAVAHQDAKAIEVIKEFQAHFPGGKVTTGDKLPPPPPELAVLQQGRDQMILAARSRLADALGKTGFENVAAFVEKRISYTQPALPDRR